MKEIIVKVNEDVLNEAVTVLDDIGIDVESAVRMFLKRVVRDNSIAFVLPNSENVTPPLVSTQAPINLAETRTYEDKMRKSNAVKLFRARGKNINKAVTFSSKNKASFLYWSNPDFSVLEEDWTLILNDWVNKKMYLFDIPANSISFGELIPRADKAEKIDIEIFDDNTFTDKISRYSFAKYLVDEVSY